MSMTGFLITFFIILMFLNMPLAFAMGAGSLVALLIGGIDPVILPQRMMFAVNSFPLMAIPLFMIAGEIMVKAGMVSRMVDFANTLVGRYRGGLATATVLTATMMSTVTGAAVASASALASTVAPEVRKHYGAGFTSGLIAASANLGAIIPPSNAMIVYALMAGGLVSVGALFVSAIIPGLLIAVLTAVLAYIIIRIRKLPATGEPFSLRKTLLAFRSAIVIVAMPVIVIGGIVGGVFTPTEGAAIAVMYASIIGFFFTRELKLKHIPDIMFRAAINSAIVGAMIAFASTITFIFTIDLIPLQLATFIQGVTDNPHVFLALIMIALLIIGMALESNAAYIMLVPLFAPVAMLYGLDPLWFAFLFCLNKIIGMLTPPVGVLLFVTSGVMQLPFGKVLKESLPFTAVQGFVLLLCIFFPDIVLWLPRTLGMH